MKKGKNIALQGKHGKPIVTDVFFNPEKKKQPIIVFCHGYKGFKDWGAWNLMAEAFAEKGFFFVKFNFSHNGGTLTNPIDFPDLDAFAENNYIKELDDLKVVLDWLSAADFPYAEYADASNVSLIGHSRGGGIVIIKAAEDKRVKKLITLASVADYGSRFPDFSNLKKWEEEGVTYVENGRTKQQMPHNFQFYKNFKENEERLNIERAAKALKIPYLIVHGEEDPAVDKENAVLIHSWAENTELFLVEEANHIFGASHPWEKNELPEQFRQIVEKSADFLI